uniref:von Willebrand factor A domain-containing protein 5A-like n=1 Tax=Hucho hucho TaxID=62062 RepID=A0A4W5KHF6_9TELE
MTVHRLGARTLIQSLEMEEREQDGEKEGVKEKVVELSVQSGVSSAFTAYIAVHKGDGEALQGQLLRRQVPTPMLYHSPMPMMCCSSGQYSARSNLLMNVTVLSKNSLDALEVFDYDKNCYEDFDSLAPASKPVTDPLLQLISLQKASGSWVLEAALAEVLGKTEEEVAKPKPAQVDQEVWATVLAMVWLYGFKMEAQEEWQFLAMKAVSWIQAQKATSVSACVQAGNNLLGCQVQKDTLGL